MRNSLPDIYAEKALNQVPRLLGNLDRNPFSPTYGCFHRDYWLEKVSDFPDAVRQFGVHSLALVYKYDFPNNMYKGNRKIRDWTIAAMCYWARIQHKEGSFDEFYPFERGWVGPTAFTTYTVAEAYRLLRSEMSEKHAHIVHDALGKAANFIIGGQIEEDHLANHHAMACLAVWKVFELFRNKHLKAGYDRLWQGFLSYQTKEGWSIEYDGVDPGYLSATVSFLAKIYQTKPDDDSLFEVLKQSVDICRYFAYPNGFYAGSLGSRNTQHFYCHGFEVLADKLPNAAAVAEKMLGGLSNNAQVPPQIMSDRYVFYRVPEFLLAYLDYKPRKNLSIATLPYEKKSLNAWLPKAKIWAKRDKKYYLIANLAKGGVVKAFDVEQESVLLNDCGVLGVLNDGRVVTTQWVDNAYETSIDEEGWEITGNLNVVPSNKLFTPFKNIIFRSIMLCLGWHPRLAHMIKGQIRRILMLGNRRISVRFWRRLSVADGAYTLTTQLKIEDKTLSFRRLQFGDEFFVRYVPQSRYFQWHELVVEGKTATPEEIAELNGKGHIQVQQYFGV